MNVQSVDFYYNIKSLVYDVVINEIKHRCIFIIFIATKVCTDEKSIKKPLYNPRAIPSLNSYFPFILHALVGKRGRSPELRAFGTFRLRKKRDPLSGTIANLPKRFTRIHSSLLKFPRNDHSIVHGRPRIGAESSFTPTLSSIGYLGVGRVRLSSRQGEFIRYSARERAESTLASSRLGFFNPFTSCPPYPKRAWVSS